MLHDGDYVAWFRTPRGSGTGKVRLADGRISGEDTIISYGGSYEVEGNRFTATLTTRRHSAGHESVFGEIDEVEIRLVGTCNGRTAQANSMQCPE